MKGGFRYWIFFLLICAVVSSCAGQPPVVAYDPPGFFSGLWHGFSILFSLIGSIFWNVRIYSYPNSGVGYDWGFFLGAAVWLGAGR
jgi:hypothetical protein